MKDSLPVVCIDTTRTVECGQLRNHGTEMVLCSLFADVMPKFDISN